MPNEPEFESPKCNTFISPRYIHTGSGVQALPSAMNNGSSFLAVKRPAVRLTFHLHLVSSLRMSGPMPPFPQTFMVVYRDNLTSYHS